MLAIWCKRENWARFRKVLVEYVQDWLMKPEEQAGNKQALWRTDPARSGVAVASEILGLMRPICWSM